MKTPQTDPTLEGSNSVGEPVPEPVRLSGYLRYLLFFICLASLFAGTTGNR